MSKAFKIFLTVAAGLLVLLCAGGAYGVFYLKKVVDHTVTADTYQKISKGDPEDHVRQITGGNQKLAKEGIKGHEPAVPAGAACDYSLAESIDQVYRFCFADGKLVQKLQIDIDADDKK
jgi:hypothetical protein